MKSLSYGRQVIEDDDIEAVVRVLKSDYLTCGPEVSAFEEELAKYCGSKFAVACANGTAALHLASMAMGIESKSEIITTPLTFAATSNSALYCGAKITFVDIDPITGCISPKEVEKYLATRPESEYKVKAIYAVHFAGMVADIQALSEIANRYQLMLLEDSCHAIGSSYKVKQEIHRAGSASHSKMSVFSFHPVKHMTTGEGGAITLNDSKLYQQLQALRAHGMVRDPGKWQLPDLGFSGEMANPWYHEMQEFGYNYRLTDIQAALGRSQLNKLDRFISERKKLANMYRQLMRDMKLPVRAMYPEDYPGHSYHLFPVLIPFKELQLSRGDLMRALAKDKIFTQVHYIPVYRHPFYQELMRQGQVQVYSSARCDEYYEQCLSLPLFPGMDESDVRRVLQSLEHNLGASKQVHNQL